MGIFGRGNKLSQNDTRALVANAILTIQHEGHKAAMSFSLSKNKADQAKQILAKDWGITDWGTSMAMLERLSKAKADSHVIAEIFNELITKSQYEVVRGIFSPLKEDILLDLNLPENFLQLWDSLTNNANNDMDAFLYYLSGAEDANKTFHGITSSLLLSRINGGIKGYEQAIRTLGVYGFSMEELSKLDDFCAWDLGRVGYVAKMAAVAGHIDDAAARGYMVSAGKQAYASYTDWRQFLAAYFIGHGIMAGDAKKIGDYGDTIHHLLRNKKSPYQKFPLKTLDKS
ncbi:MAG: DUF1266 domain-containing protein [Defluviitaleaceae bacterium]|nr:DUF1266 domain-containing protein [Defluviitaleaceae bacterium]